MVSDIAARLKKYNIDKQSELGKALIRLDSMYARIEELKKEKNQLEDDVEMLEMMIMYKINKGNRQNEV